MENGQLLRERSQALDRELSGVLMKISDTVYTPLHYLSEMSPGSPEALRTALSHFHAYLQSVHKFGTALKVR